MKRRTLSFGFGFAVLFVLASVLQAHGESSDCFRNSNEAQGTIIDPSACGRLKQIVTRKADIGGVETDVTLNYMVHRPRWRFPRAMVVLIAGGVMDTGITGDLATGEVTSTGTNFLVRTAALFARHGFLAVTPDRPSDQLNASGLAFDVYRTSPAHAQDLCAVIAAENDRNLDVLLVGTSRGAMSAVAQHPLGLGLSLSSPVTSTTGSRLYIGVPGYPNLSPASVTVPAAVLSHRSDACAVSTPSDGQILANDLLAAGVLAVYDELTGGFSLDPNPCRSQTFHGFLGIENQAMFRIARRLNAILRVERTHGNRRPRADPTSTSAAVIDLAPLVTDEDGDLLTFSLPHAESTRGAPISISGSVVTYTPIAAGIQDGLVFVVEDGRGGKSHAIVTIDVP